MKNIILLSFIVSSIFSNCKENSAHNKVESSNISKKIENPQDKDEKVPLVYEDVQVNKRDFIENGKNYSAEYKINDIVLKLTTKDEENEFYSEVYHNNKKIGNLQKNSLTTNLYFFKNKNLGLIFFENGDEGGIWGYTVFLVKDMIVSNVGFLDASSTKDTELNKFINPVQNGGIIEINFLEDEVYSKGENISNQNISVKIDIKKSKFILYSKKNNVSIHPLILKSSSNSQSISVDFNTKIIKPSTDNIFFENNSLIVQKEIEENNPHDFINYKYYFHSTNNSVILDKIEFKREAYVEYVDICKFSYTYFPSETIHFSEVDFFNQKFVQTLIRDISLNQAIEIVTKTNQSYDCTSNLNTKELDFLLKKTVLDNKSVNNYNNLAYHLEQNKQYETSCYLLKKIIDKYPNRVVAWLNYGDALWGMNEIQQGKRAYQKYILLMKNQRKDLSKIPQKVYQRIK